MTGTNDSLHWGHSNTVLKTVHDAHSPLCDHKTHVVKD